MSLGLTRVGEGQAAHAAMRLRHLPVTRIHCSTMKRAYETAIIIAKQHRGRSPARAHLLRECVPSMPRDRRKQSPGISDQMIRRGRARAERAYRRYFRRPGRQGECELLVCHGNLIRYFVGRVLGLGLHGWYQLDTSHCGITVIRIPKEGKMFMVCYNDAGHVPIEPG